MRAPLLRLLFRPNLFTRVAMFCAFISLLSVGTGAVLFLRELENAETARLSTEAAKLKAALLSVTIQKINDEPAILERCQELVRTGSGVSYILLEPYGNESITLRPGEWAMESVPQPLRMLGTVPNGVDAINPWNGEPVLHFCVECGIAGIPWGMIHFGLNKAQYQQARIAAMKKGLASAGVCGVIAVLGAFFVARRIARPVAELNRMAHRLADGDLAARASIRTSGEIAELAESMNRMATEVNDGQQQLRERAELEHELALINADFLAGDPDSMDQTFQRALLAAGSRLRGDGASVLLFSEHRDALQREWSWHARGARVDALDSYPVQTFAWGISAVTRAGVLTISRADELPAEASAERLFLERHQLAAVGAAYLGSAEKPAGVLLIWSRQPNHIWSAPDKQFLQTVAGTISNAVIRRDAARDRDRLQAQLLQSQKMEAVGKLSGGIAHDFNNMLVPIVGYSDSLLNSAPPDAPWLNEIREIKRAAESAAALTRQLLTFSRKQIISRNEINLNELVLTLKKMLRRLIGENVDLVTRLAPDAWSVSADAGQVEQCLVNLCVNARHAIPQNGSITIKSEMIDSEDADFAPPQSGRIHGLFLRLSVQDTGGGMSQETLNRIFEPFYSTKGSEGTGLGLSVVHGVMEQHGGWITVRSIVGEGTTFQLYFPALREVATAVVEDTVQAKPAPLAKGSGETILLIEDEAGVLAFVTAALRQNGYKVISADCGAVARRLFAEHADELDLVMSDVVLPDVSGVDLMEEFFSVRPALKALLSSGYSEKNSLVALVQKRGLCFLHKPYTLAQLLNAIRQTLEGTTRTVVA